MAILAMDFCTSITSSAIYDYISIFIVSILLQSSTNWKNAKVNGKEPIFATFLMLLVWLPINFHFFINGGQWNIMVLGNFKNWSIKILLILKRFSNLLCNIFINVNRVQNSCTLRCNLILIIVCLRGSTRFCYSCKNVMHFFKPNPFASTCTCLTLCLLIFVICPLHLVNFLPTLLGCTFWN